MKCAYGYMLYDIRSLNWEDDATTIKNMAKAPLEHRFGEHKYCSEKWCRVLQAKKEGKSYSPPASDPFLCKKKDKQIYEQLKEIFDKFTCEKILKESLHWMNTQQNEAMNNVIARLCPKNKHLSETTTLLTRVCIAITYSNIGISKMYSLLLQRLGVPITGHLKMCLERLDQIRTRSAKRKRSREYKAKRKYGDKAKQNDQIYLERTSDKKFGTYRSGIAFECPIGTPTSTDMSKSSFQEGNQLNLTNNQKLKQGHTLYSKVPSSVTAQEDPVFTLTPKYTTKESKQKHSPHTATPSPTNRQMKQLKSTHRQDQSSYDSNHPTNQLNSTHRNDQSPYESNRPKSEHASTLGFEKRNLIKYESKKGKMLKLKILTISITLRLPILLIV